MLWTFSGEDGGEPGTFHPSSNTSLCLDVGVDHAPPVKLVPCAAGAPGQMWKYASATGHLGSVSTPPCIVASRGKTCR